VQLWGQWYFNGDLTAERLGESVYLRYRDEDMARVFVFTMKDEYIGEAAIMKRLPVFGADKEDIRAAHSEAKRVKRITRDYAAISDEIAAEPDDLTRILARKKQEPPHKPIMPKVIEPVRVSRELNIAAQQIGRIAVGGGMAPTYEQQRVMERERIRETMQAVRRSMSMPKQ
jgi:hypothetical protein